MKVIIKDFQAIQEANLNIKGFTLLVGETSQGKSACCRALYCATHNRFKAGQVRYGQDHAVVKIKLDEDNHVLSVIRPWSGSIRMSLGDVNFTKIGKVMPKPIADFLNFGTLDVSGDNYSLHFHHQFQKPLLLEYSQQKVMSLLSASKGMDDLNLLKDHMSQVRVKNKGAFNAVSALLEEAQKNHEEIFKKYEKMESLQAKLVSLEELYNQEITRYSQLLELQEFVSQKPILQEKESKLKKLVSLLEELDTDTERESDLSKISTLCMKEIDLANKIATYDRFIQLYDSDAEKRRSDLHKLRDLVNEHSQLVILIETKQQPKVDKLKEILKSKLVVDTLNRAIQDMETLKARIGTYNELCEHEKDLNKIVVDKICPVCGSKVQ